MHYIHIRFSTHSIIRLQLKWKYHSRTCNEQPLNTVLGSEGEKNGSSELRSVLAHPAHPRLLRILTMDILTQSTTSLARGGNAEVERNRTHRGRRSSEARIQQSLL